MPRYAFVAQHSQEDCGAACVATVARHYGKKVAMPLVRQLVGTGQQGTTLLGLRRGSEELGFHCRALRTDVDASFFKDVQQIELPAIVHWEGNHWVVLHAVQRREVVISDPAIGVRRIAHQDFLESWGDGVLLTLQPDLVRLNRQPDDKSKLHFVERILRLASPHKGLVLRAAALNAVIGLIGLSVPLLMQVLTDDILVRRDAQLLGVLAIGMVIIYGFRSLIALLQGKITSYFFERLELSLLLEYGYKLLRMPMQYFDTHRSGDILNRIIEVGRVNAIFNALLLDLPSDLFVALISLVVMVLYSPVLALIAVAAYVVIVVVQLAFLQKRMDIAAQQIRKNANMQALLVEFFRGAQVLKSTPAGPQAWDEYQGEFGELANLSWRDSQLRLTSDSLVELFSSLLQVGLLIYGSTFVLAGKLSIGQLLAFAGMGMNVLAFLQESSGFLVQVLSDRSIFQRLMDVLEGRTEDGDARQKCWVDLNGRESIELKRLSFSHPGRRAALSNINAMIPGAKITALVGGSGSGKSTLAKLISGMYEAKDGTIRIGEAFLSDISVDCLRNQVCLVTQDSHFFNRTIIENFRFSHPAASYVAIVSACKLAMADEFIAQMPNGYNTKLGEFGANLSGGQKQRLAIARAVAANPAILILDESTNALDPVLEDQVLTSVLSARQGKLTILISHRPSMIARCDHLVYLENGTLKYQGPACDVAAGRIPALERYLASPSHG